MRLIWEDQTIEYPLWKKLVGVQRNGKRPLDIQLSPEEMKELDTPEGKEYLVKTIKASIRKQ